MNHKYNVGDIKIPGHALLINMQRYVLKGSRKGDRYFDYKTIYIIISALSFQIRYPYASCWNVNGKLLQVLKHVTLLKKQFLKGQVAWISEKERLPVKTSAKANFYGEKLSPCEKPHHVRFYNRRKRNYVIYVHIDVNLDGRGWVCCCSTFNSHKRKWWCSCLKSRPPAL